MSKETVALSQALRAPNARGRWGELTLRRVAELAGMVPFCDFTEQDSGGGMRPDMIVRRGLCTPSPWMRRPRFQPISTPKPRPTTFGGPHSTATRSRFPPCDAIERTHARILEQLAARARNGGLVLPGDHFLGAALERDPDLLERALARKCCWPRPLTLVSVLKGIAYGWRQERLAKSADELRRISTEFYEHRAGFRGVLRGLR